MYVDLPNDCAEYRVSVIRWIGEKLARQATITNPVLDVALNGELQWRVPISFHVTVDTTGTRRPLPAMARKQLEAEIADLDVIDRGALVQRLKTALGELGVRGHPLEIVDSPTSDLAVLMVWLQKRAAARGVPIGTVSLSLGVGHSAEDVLLRLKDQLSQQGLDFTDFEQSVVDAQGIDTQTESFVADLAAHKGGAVVLVFDSIDDADPPTFGWLESLHEALVAAHICALIIVVRSQTHRRQFAQTEARFDLGPFAPHDIAEHLRERFGLGQHAAEIAAKETFAFSNGEPVRVHAGFVLRRNALIECLTP